MTRDESTGKRPRGSAKRPAKPRPTPSVAESGEDKAGRQRIAKAMARAGLCSRRDAEGWIAEGRVSVNGTVLSSPAVDIGPEDRVLVDGLPLPAADKTRLFLFHKPRGLITSDHDPEGRATIFDHLGEHWPDGPRVVTIGRLDINTEGLLLLTNDGGLARILELPATGWVRRYRVRAKGATDQAVLDRLADGITIDGIDYAGIEAKLDRVQGANCWLTMGLREGKNREVKRVLEHIGLEVNRLIRLSFGPFQLLDLPEGAVEEVKTRILRDQLGPTLAAEAGVDFSEPDAMAPIVAAPVIAAKGAKRPGARDGTIRGDKPSPTTARPPRASDTRSGVGASRGRNFRDRERDDDVVTAPERERPVAGPRKHVSTLRAQTGVAARSGPRKRLERTDTTDRKNRTVQVERLVSREPEPVARGSRERPETPRGRPRLRERADSARERPAFGARSPASTASGRPPRETRASPSAIGKRERIARSGGASERAEERERPRTHREDRTPREGRTPRRERTAAPSSRSPTSKPFGKRSDGDRAGAGRPATGRNRPSDKPMRSRPSSGKRSNAAAGDKDFAGKDFGGKDSGVKRPPRSGSSDKSASDKRPDARPARGRSSSTERSSSGKRGGAPTGRSPRSDKPGRGPSRPRG